MKNKSHALHNLICQMLRGGQINNLDSDAIKTYIYNAGVALHNLPLSIANGSDITIYEFNQVNQLDPTATPGEWGDWCKMIASDFQQQLPSKPDPTHINFFNKKSKKNILKTIVIVSVVLNLVLGFFFALHLGII